jgi:hypothetical protein
MMIHQHDPGPARDGGAARSAPSRDTARLDGAYRLLVIRGLSTVEAGNIVAYLNGLHAVEQGWTLQEIKHLVALRSQVAAGVIPA